MGIFTRGTYVNGDLLEAKANHYTMKCQINSFLILTVVWILNVLNIFIIDSTLMNRGFFFSFLITLACYLVNRLGGGDKPWIKYVLLLLTVLFAVTLGIFLTYQAILVAMLPLLYSMQYHKRKVVYYTYLLTVIGTFTCTVAGYFFGLCDANMLTLTTGPMSQYVDAETGGLLFETINLNPWLSLSLYYALPRCMINMVMK